MLHGSRPTWGNMGYSVLVVDDSRICRKTLIKMMEASGLPIDEVLEAEHGPMALDILSDSKTDCIFLDINMPLLNGVEFMREIAQDDALNKIPVVIVSTEGSKERIDELQTLGVKAILRKPVTARQFFEIVSPILNQNGNGKSDWEATLDKVPVSVRSVLEQWAHIAVENVPHNEIKLDASKPVILVSMPYSGKYNGKVEVAVQDGMVRVVAEQLLGKREEMAPGEALDVVRELTNVITGNLITDLYGTDHLLALSQPMISYPNVSQTWEHFAKGFAFKCDGIPLLVQIVQE